MQRKATTPPRDLYIELEDTPEDTLQKLLAILSETAEQARSIVLAVDTIAADLTSGSTDDIVALLLDSFSDKRVATVRQHSERLSLLIPRVCDGGKYARLKRKQKTSGVVKYRGKLYQQVKS